MGIIGHCWEFLRCQKNKNPKNKKVIQRAGNRHPYTPHNIKKEVDRLGIFLVHSSGMRIGLDKGEKVHFLDFGGRKMLKIEKGENDLRTWKVPLG